jgi:hypothetical protein
VTNYNDHSDVHFVGKPPPLEPDEVVGGVEVREVGNEGDGWIQSYGIINGGLEIMRQAWGNLQHVFSVRKDHQDPPDLGVKSMPTTIRGTHRYPRRLLSKSPVDLLVVELGGAHTPTETYAATAWEELIDVTEEPKRPKGVVESWTSGAHLWRKGPMSKASITRWGLLGYNTHCKLVRATEVGGAIRQARLIVVRWSQGAPTTWTWGKTERDPELVRAMSNLLTPPGLVPRKSYVTSHGHNIPDARQDPMPANIGSYVRTEKGVRKITAAELARGLGLTKSESENSDQALIERSTSLFIWEYLASSIAGTAPEKSTQELGTREGRDDDTTTNEDTTDRPNFQWTPPDLKPGGLWHSERVKNLRTASLTYSDFQEVYSDGIDRLHIHRGNYNETGPSPKWLQLLWWEFPPEHWEELRAGARQNFLKTPPHLITPNAPMDDEARIAAGQFADELLSLGVVRTIEEGREVLANAPLFVVPKEGQVGEWRVIADMLRGGQNTCVGQDPVFLPRVSHILDEMYRGGYTAVVDLSKFFYNFPTHPDDRPYLGFLHPVSGILYCYFGLAMGAGNSPALATRFGLAFVRKMKEKSALFQGRGRANCWWTSFRSNGYDPDLGHGFVFEGPDGPAVKIWVFVDDFLIHGPTYEKTAAALSFFLDTAVECGFLFHPKKLITPCQEVKYCGVLFNTDDIPCLKIPVSKRERSLAMVEHLQYADPNRTWSRLSLAVVAGVLESLSEATPRRLGHTHLRYFHSLVHPEGGGTGAAQYYTSTRLTDTVRAELAWWARFLETGDGRYARPQRAATLVPTFGDGSGTGTGGTYILPDGEPLRMWLGKWHPYVYQFSSNWKELATLKQTLIRIKRDRGRKTVQGTVVFYFTDNSGVYWIAAAGSSRAAHLHRLIVEIRLLEIELDCFLQVIHVPGLVLIEQGTDGLSRGIWMSALHSLRDEARLLQAIFDPVTFDPSLVWEALPSTTHRSHPWTHKSWNGPWTPTECLNRLTVWCPPPEMARQLLSFLLNTWVERPYTTSALLFIPRTAIGMWHGLSRYVHEIGTIFPHQRTMRFPPLLPIPIIVLYIGPHHCTLSSKNRLERTPISAHERWHRGEAARMRGLPTRPLAK